MMFFFKQIFCSYYDGFFFYRVTDGSAEPSKKKIPVYPVARGVVPIYANETKIDSYAIDTVIDNHQIFGMHSRKLLYDLHVGLK